MESNPDMFSKKWSNLEAVSHCGLRAILWPFTMKGILNLWQRYRQLLGDKLQAQERLTNYNAILQCAVLDEQQKEAQQQ
jgi:hypothetical protein